MASRVLLIVVVLAGVAAPAQDVAASESGASAPEGCWPLRGGATARTGVTRSAPVAEALEEAWHVDLPGTIESEPLVWDDQVIVSVALPAGARQLHVLGLRDGQKAAAPKSFEKCGRPLDPCLVDDLVAVRAGTSAVEVLRRGTRLDSRWKQELSGRVLSLLFHEGALYALATEQIARLDPMGRRVMWSQTGKFRGALALRGPHLYALAYDGDGNAHLHAYGRDGGRLEASAHVGHHEGVLPDEDAEATVVALEHVVAVHHALPVPVEGGRATATFVSRRVDPSGGLSLAARGAMDAPLPFAGGAEWFGFLRDGGTKLVTFAGSGDDLAFATLAGPDEHPELVKAPVPLSIAGDLVHAGGRTFLAGKGTILWEGPEAVRFRAVPAREAVLLVTGERRLEAWRRPASGSGGEGFRRPEAASLTGGKAVLADGSTVQGSLDYDPAAAKLKRGRTAYPLGDVWLVADGDGRLVHARDRGSLTRGLALLAREALADAYLALVDEARRAQAIDLADRLVDEARRSGADEAALAPVVKRLDAARKQAKPADAAARAAVQARADAASKARASIYWSALESLPADASDLRLAVLAEVLAIDPDHAGARGELAARLPMPLAADLAKDPAGALELARAAAQTPIHLIDPPAPDQSKLSHGQRQLGALRHTWRPDLIALESQQLLILSPLSTPGSIARCLSMGELVCAALEKLFAGGERKRDARYPLELHLYESKEEYLREGTKGVTGFGKASTESLEWTAGHYDELQNLSRIYLPAKEDAFASVMNTYAHELTHHWIPERCPHFSSADVAKQTAGTPGYWIVEGFATFIEEGRFDLAGRSFDPWNPRASSLDTVANASRLLPWGKVLGDNQVAFARLDVKPKHQVPFRWRLGYAKLLSDKNLFYAQAAAACHYLFHADEGRHRSRLLDFVRLHYTGATTPTAVADLFGTAPDALGERIVAWARGVIRAAR